ncbi:MAG TPA: xanthine dehydrogenase family protein subunit M [Stellaceae bacterium]|jgi:xanthine dehydrogenase YagS FAD-binding subunit|nr:xanthine dehydrogenase family protein subunit M [Stellaceae bacterium]
MVPFRYERGRDVAEVVTVASRDRSAEFLAGGTDMLQLLKDDVRRPGRIIDVTRLPDLDRIESHGQGIRFGALVKMSDAADHPEIRANYPVIAEALLASASPQIRNMATIGGNLLQRTRCVYFRDHGTACNKREPGSGCAALYGENRLHAVLGVSDYCVATHASDLAVALVALDAVVVTARAGGGRRIPLEEFHLLPGETPERETVLEPGELIVAVDVPPLTFASRSHYLKVRDRASFEFALAAAAVAADVEGGVVRDARIALGGVGTRPWRARSAEEALIGQRANKAAFERVATEALAGAKPAGQNGFKIPLAQRTLVRALSHLKA